MKPQILIEVVSAVTPSSVRSIEISMPVVTAEASASLASVPVTPATFELLMADRTRPLTGDSVIGGLLSRFSGMNGGVALSGIWLVRARGA